MLHRTHYRLSLLLLVALAIAPLTSAQDAALPTGDELVASVNSRNDGASLVRTMKITMTDKRDKSREQLTKTFRKYYDGEKKSTIFYLEPANIRDTGFLTFDYYTADKEDDQWLYLPELRRVRRISSSNRGGYYLGTDMTYEDMKLDTRLSTTDYNYTVVGTETIDGSNCYVLEGIPKAKKIADELGYGKFRAHVDTERLFQHKTEMWDVNGNPLKTISWQDWIEVNGVWVVQKMVAVNTKTEHSTTFEFTEIDVESEIDDDMFTEQALKRGYRGN